MKFIILLSLFFVGVSGCSTNSTVAECQSSQDGRDPATACDTKPIRERHILEKLNRP